MNTESKRHGLTVKEFQERYKVSRTTVYYWAKRNGLKLTKIGPRSTRIMREDETRWLASRQGVAQ